MKLYETKNDGYLFSTNKNLLEIDSIHKFLSESYWAKKIPKEIVVKSIEGSIPFGIYTNERKQIAFARVITDKTTFAYLADVFVLPEYRKKGFSKKLMQFIMDHPALQGLRRWMLATADAHGLYEQYGFKLLSKPERMMEITRPDIYL